MPANAWTEVGAYVARLEAERDALRAAVVDVGGRLVSLADRLDSPARPGHVEYVSKADAASACRAYAREAAAALAKAQAD